MLHAPSRSIAARSPAAEATFPADDLDLADFRQRLANLLRQSDRAAEAEPLYRAALAAREKALAPQDARLAATLEGLGRSLEMLDRFAEAVEPLPARTRDPRAGERSGERRGCRRPDAARHRADAARPAGRRRASVQAPARDSRGRPGRRRRRGGRGRALDRQRGRAPGPQGRSRDPSQAGAGDQREAIWTRRPVDRPRPLVAGASLCGAATRRGGRTVAGACCRHSGSDRRRQRKRSRRTHGAGVPEIQFRRAGRSRRADRAVACRHFGGQGCGPSGRGRPDGDTRPDAPRTQLPMPRRSGSPSQRRRSIPARRPKAVS